MLDINVNISLTGAVGSIGSGVPCIVVSKSTREKDFKEYSESKDLIGAGFAEDSGAYKLFQIMKMQKNPPAAIGIIETAGKAVSVIPKLAGKVRQIITLLGDGDSTVAEVAKAVEATNSLIYFPVIKQISEATGLESLDRTCVGVHSKGQDLAAALVGATAGYESGSFTYKNVLIKGVAPDDITDGDVKLINNENKSGNVYGYTIQRKAGDIVTTEGKSAAGEYLDIVDAFDWIISNIAYQAQKLLNNSKKVTYDDSGIGMLEGVTNSVLKEADTKGMIAHDENKTAMYETDFGRRSDTSSSDRSARVYKLGKFSFDLAGAIHTATINGTATI